MMIIEWSICFRCPHFQEFKQECGDVCLRCIFNYDSKKCKEYGCINKKKGEKKYPKKHI